MQLSTIMTTAPRCISPETPLEDAVALMDEADVRHLPVVSDAGRLIGIVSDRDLLEATGWLPRGQRDERPRDHTDPTTVEHVMHRHVVTASPEDTVISAAIDLVGRKIGCLPILRGGALVGIVSEMDIVAAYLDRMESRATCDDNPAIEHVMTWHPATIAWDATVGEARRLMRVDDMRHLPVTEDGRLVGILSDRDLRRAYGEGRSKETPVGEVMTRDLVTLTTAERTHDAARTFIRSRISAAPVLDELDGAGTLVGIVTVTDLLDHSLGTLRDEPTISNAS